MTTLLQDVVYGIRMMARSPIVSGVAILSLALGIAANTSMFSILNAWLFEALPYADQDELVLVRTWDTDDPIEFAGGISVPNYRDLVAAAPSIESSTVYTMERSNLTGLDRPEQLTVVVATPSLFEVLGVPPALGRGFRAEEGVEGAGRVLVLEHDYWQRRFLGDPGVLGLTVVLDGDSYTIVGIMPEAFDMVPANVHAFRPSNFDALIEDRGTRGHIAFLRMRDGATPEEVRREIDATGARLVTEFPEANRGVGFVVQTVGEFFPGPTDRQLVLILSVVTLFGLLIACANIANLLLGRAEERQREVAVRTAMGAGRARLIRQMLTESVTMGVIAGGIGVVLSIWIIRWLQGIMPVEMPAAFLPRLDMEVIAATLMVAVAAGVAFGLAPALHSVGANLREALGNGARGGTAGRARKRIRNAFVVGEVAVALGLLAGAGFLIEAFERLSNQEAGFEAEGLLTFQISISGDRYDSDPAVATYQTELEDALLGIGGVNSVALMSSLPRGRDNPRAPYAMEGRPVVDEADLPTAGLQSVSPGFFETLGIEILQGRGFSDGDRFDGEAVAIVSESLARREFGDGDVLGRRIRVSGTPRRIVGVAGDVLQERIALAGQGGELVYLPSAQAPLRNPSFAVRTEGEPGAIAADVRQAVWSVNADQPVADVQTLEAFIAASLAGPRSISLFLMVMGGIALALATMGIYGVMAHAVAQRQREIGIRMALGADRGAVVGLVARSGLLLVGIGLAAGLPLAYLMFRGAAIGLNLFQADLNYGYSLGLTGALVAVAVVATFLPARRASGVAPVAALKD